MGRMARPKSDDKRSAIMRAAIRVIAADGLGAATATIAKEAGVSNGSLFTYFETKADLLNRLYVELKTEMAAVGLVGLPNRSGIRKQAQYMWSHLLHWGTSFPEKRRVIAQSAYRTRLPRRVVRPVTQRSPASQIFWSEAAKTDRCATFRWRSSSGCSTRMLTRRSTS